MWWHFWVENVKILAAAHCHVYKHVYKDFVVGGSFLNTCLFSNVHMSLSFFGLIVFCKSVGNISIYLAHMIHKVFHPINWKKYIWVPFKTFQRLTPCMSLMALYFIKPHLASHFVANLMQNRWGVICKCNAAQCKYNADPMTMRANEAQNRWQMSPVPPW